MTAKAFAPCGWRWRIGRAAKLIRAAQDVLTLLSQEGIYMDDLPPERARPEVWRKFAQGERGRAIAALGGIRDRSSLALTGARMREDPVFRDAGHHFLRTFDKTFQEFEKNASDADLAELADTPHRPRLHAVRACDRNVRLTCTSDRRGNPIKNLRRFLQISSKKFVTRAGPPPVAAGH